MLLPGLRRLRRGRHAVQLGVDPGRAVVLEPTDDRLPQLLDLLDLLDGEHTEAQLLARADQAGIQPKHLHQLLDTLRAAGLLLGDDQLLPADLPEPTRRRLAGEAGAIALRQLTARPSVGSPALLLRRRAAARVLIRGEGPLATAVGAGLAAAGVGHVHVARSGPVRTGDLMPGGLTAADLGRPADAAAADVISAAAPGTVTRPVPPDQATFVIQFGSTPPAELVAYGYARRKLAHLVVDIRDGVVVLGPLVTPGGSPCLNCVDLYRRDRDPDWPALAAQLAVGDAGASHPGPAVRPCGTAILLVAAGFAVGEVLAHLDGEQPQTLGASVELHHPGQLRRRTWAVHPGCDCHRRQPPPEHRQTFPGSIGTA